MQLFKKRPPCKQTHDELPVIHLLFWLLHDSIVSLVTQQPVNRCRAQRSVPPRGNPPSLAIAGVWMPGCCTSHVRDARRRELVTAGSSQLETGWSQTQQTSAWSVEPIAAHHTGTASLDRHPGRRVMH
ncbi:unnamed protein product [Gadus morhua 'NCC']